MAMLLKEFLQHRLNNEKWNQSVYFFVALQYQSLFASYLLQGLKNRDIVTTFSFVDHQFSDFESIANTTFLGQTSVIWLGDCSEYEINIRKKLNIFLKKYSGPHTIIAFYNEKDCNEIEIDSLLYAKNFDFQTVQLFFEYAIGKKVLVEKRLAQGYSCEQIITFYLYTFFINDPQVFIKSGWLEKLFMQDASLFELSKLFFAKKKEAFFELWNRISESYGPVFWTVFWSEQLWNAFLVVHLRKKNEFNNAKQVQGRLPFSFLQYDWQNYTPQELQKAHHFIVNLDRNIKLSASADSIELFYYIFFKKN